MNRRPNQSRTGYDSFSPQHAARFKAATPDARFFDARKKQPLYKRMGALICCALLLSIFFNLVANQFIFVRQVSVPVRGLTEDFEGYTLLHLSDLKGKSFLSNQSLFRLALGKKSYDAVVMTGDMVSNLGNAQPLYELIDQLRMLNAEAPVYFIPGDSDPTPTSEIYFSGGSPFAPWVLGAQQRGAQLLSSPAAIIRGDQTLWLTTGSLLSLDIDTMQGQFELQYLRALSSGDENAIELATHNLKWLEETRSARNSRQASDVCVTLTHTPPSDQDTWLSQTQLVLCGHYLGGLLRLPFLGPLFIPSPSLPRYGILPGNGTYSGLHKKSGAWVYANPGMGSDSSDYPSFFFRFFNPPTATLITLTPSSL